MQTMLRPRTAAELLDTAFQVIRAHANVVFVLLALAALPLLLAGLVSVMVMPSQAAMMAAAEAGQPAAPAVAMVTMFGVQLLAWIAFFVLGTALYGATSDALLGRPVTVERALALVRRRGVNVLKTSILKWVAIWALMVAVALALGGAFLIHEAAGIVVAIAAVVAYVYLVLVRWYLAGATAALEERDSTNSLARASTLVRGAGWRVLAVVIALYVVLLAIAFASLSLAAIGGGQVVQALLTLPFVFLYPVANVLEALVYVDQRVRNEALDLEVMASAIDGATAVLPPAPSDLRQPA